MSKGGKSVEADGGSEGQEEEEEGGQRNIKKDFLVHFLGLWFQDALTRDVMMTKCIRNIGGYCEFQGHVSNVTSFIIEAKD